MKEVANERSTPAAEVAPAPSSPAADSPPERLKLHKDLSCSVPSEVSLLVMVGGGVVIV